MQSKGKLWCLLLTIAMIAAFPLAAADETSKPGKRVGFSGKHDLSPPLRDLVKIAGPVTPKASKEIPHLTPAKKPAAPPANERDILLGPVVASAPMPPPLITFDGPDDDDNAVVAGFRLAPPDSNGDVGPNHYVQFVNLIFEIFDKTTGATVLGPAKGNSLWTGFGGVCETTNDGDPIALWDQFAGRWLMSQFAINTGTQCIAISQTADPTGSWHRYAFDISPGLNDYPKIGVWPDGYYLMFNEFNPSFTQTSVVAFEKDKMILGLPAQFVVIDVPPAGGELYFAVQPPHVEGLAAPPAGSAAPFVMAYDDEDWGSPAPDPINDFYKIWHFAVDWTDPLLSTFTGPINVPAPDWDDNMCNFSRDCIPQPATTQKVDSFSDVTMYRSVYRNFGTHQSLYVVTGADVGGDHEGVRWAEIRDPIGTPTLHQAGTHAPDADHRFVPSIAADKDGNILISYSVSSAATFPSIRYAGRLATDPLGTLPQTETSLLEGTASQTGPNRWGDYTTVSIDESDDCTFWITNQYQQAAGSFDWDMRIGAVKFASCTAGPSGTIAGTVIDATTLNPIEGAQVQVGAAFSTLTNASGNYAILVLEGTYDVTASKFGYNPETTTGVVVTDGATTTVDFALTAVPSLILDGFVTDGSGAGWPLYAELEFISSGGTEVVLTDPATGYYSISALANSSYTVNVTALISGYLPLTRVVNTGLVDQQENFQLLVDPACTAAGYHIPNAVAAAHFSNGIPADFTVNSVVTGCANPIAAQGWNTGSTRANTNGGTPPFAIADSDICGSSVNMVTSMTSPAFNLSAYAGDINIQYNSDYRNLCTVAAGDAVALQIWNGASWVNVFNYCGITTRRGPRVDAFTTIAGNGAADARVRWLYDAGWDWWWQVDNILVTKGVPEACAYGSGGALVWGYVTDENTGLPLVGAQVSLDTGQTTTTITTPDDPNLGDGFYMLFAPLNSGNAPGVRTATVTMDRYGTVVKNFIPTPNSSMNLNFILPAGLLTTSTDELRMRLPIGGTGDLVLTLSNSGGIDATVNLLEINAPAADELDVLIQNIPLPYDGDTKEGQLLAAARDTSALRLPSAPAVEINAAAGSFVGQWATGLEFPWGAGYNQSNPSLWVGNIAAGGGDDLNYEFDTAGNPTGNTIDVSDHSGVFGGDMAWNARTQTIWQVNIGGGDCIFEFDPVSLTVTGNKICPAFGTSMRGLAHDPATDLWYAGSWNGTQVVEFESDGTILRKINVGLGVSGLAIDPRERNLYAQVNNATQLVYVLDIDSPTFGVTGAFSLLNSSGVNAYASFEGAGLEMDCSGNLWSVNQITKMVHINGSGATDPCVTDIPWLSEDPTSGTIPPGVDGFSTITFTASGATVGCHEAQLLALNDTPYGTIPMEVGLTVQFNDVPLGAFGDAFIHAIAGAGVTAGCGGGNFCPGDVMTRRTVAVWALRAKMGSDYSPPPATGVFGDVSPESFGANYIEDFYARGITGGCQASPLLYCPESPVTRAQMAVLLLKTEEGSGYTPPACEGLFADMPCSNPFSAWAEELYRRNITGGCTAAPLQYCPNSPTTRGQMAVFTARTFGMELCQQ